MLFRFNGVKKLLPVPVELSETLIIKYKKEL